MTLKHALGTVPIIKIVGFMIDNEAQDHTQHEIQAGAEIRSGDMNRDFHCLVDSGILHETRAIRGAPLYRLDRTNRVTQALLALDDTIAVRTMDRIIDELDDEDDGVENQLLSKVEIQGL